MSNTLKVYILALVSFLVGTSEYIIAGILDKIAGSLDISLVAAGQLITVFSLVYALCTPVSMALTVRWERRRLILFSLALFAVANMLAFVLPGYGWFLAARVLMALGAGVVVVTALSLAAKISEPGRQASSIATVVMGFTASLIIGVPLGRMIAAVYDWKWVFGGIGLLALLAVIVIHRSIPATDGDAPIPLRQQLGLLRNPRIAMGLAVSFFWLGGYSITYTYISPYLLTITGMSEQTLSAALLAFGIASLVGSKLGGYSADRWGVLPTLLSGMLVHTVMLVLLALAASHWILVFPLLILWSLSAWSSGPAQQYNLVTLAPESSGIMLSLNSSAMQLSMAAGAGIGGMVLNRVSLLSITWIGAAGVAVAVVLLIVSSRLAAPDPETAVKVQQA
ncbi:putative MFS-type transporter YbcL [Paenibacillus albidus]|uniref:MFS-type transporter YbcL n=1 Tax=Paenibacillus albidus TaxID=2041023 RepID=A0A917C593_9BACL|nr:MFS transporter [Paenibacillus albidus]GGF68591.1 putative MFS-type transporter YbcL [Paenibacillus albidus]